MRAPSVCLVKGRGEVQPRGRATPVPSTRSHCPRTRTRVTVSEGSCFSGKVGTSQCQADGPRTDPEGAVPRLRVGPPRPLGPASPVLPGGWPGQKA